MSARSEYGFVTGGGVLALYPDGRVGTDLA
jgi:hypothetical protein